METHHRECPGGVGVGPKNMGQATHSSEGRVRDCASDHGLWVLGAMELDIQFKMFIFCFEIPLGEFKLSHLRIFLAAGNRKP